ncbi:MAG: tetratricopeptide repeat protein [Magnetococcales bacterium]|nr:tetratricopeptide repeat protein [Magnetococcales bacterium]
MTGQHPPPGPEHQASIVQPRLAQAMNHHLAGRLQEAELLYRQILKEDPNHADALHMFGVLAHQQGAFAVAVECLSRAVALRPGLIEAHYNLGNALKTLGQKSQALECYRQVVRLGSHLPEALLFVGNGFKELGSLEEAITCYRRAIALNSGFTAAWGALGAALKEQKSWVEARDATLMALRLQPDDADLLFTLGLIAIETRNLDEAQTHLRRGLSIRPDAPEALCNLGLVLLEHNRVDEAIHSLERALELKPDYPEALSNLGTAFQEQGRYEEAIDLYTRALTLKPDLPEIRSNMGHALQELGRLEEAVEQLQLALAQRPNDPGGLNNLGNVYKQQGRYDAAIEAYQKALQQVPDHPEVHANMGALYLEQGQWDQALDWFNRVLAIRPDHPEGHLGLGLYHLTQGALEPGWQHYEWRWRTRGFIHHGHRQPPWQGEPLPGKNLLLHCEQGYGDSIQFIRYVPLVKKATGAKVVVFAPPPLFRLFATVAGIDHLSTHLDQLPACDAQVPLLSLPYLLGTTLATIPASIPYMGADPSLIPFYRDHLRSMPGFKIGIAWRGNPKHKNDYQRSMNPSFLRPLCSVAGCCLVNLQKDPTPAEQAVFAGCDHFIDLSGMLHDFADTAAVVANLDLVIAVDTAIIHLAGAMGKKAWLLLPRVGDWRWLRQREDSPWYPGLRLIRQLTPGQWQHCIDVVVRDLPHLIANPLPRMESSDDPKAHPNL